MATLTQEAVYEKVAQALIAGGVLERKNGRALFFAANLGWNRYNIHTEKIDDKLIKSIDAVLKEIDPGAQPGHDAKRLLGLSTGFELVHNDLNKKIINDIATYASGKSDLTALSEQIQSAATALPTSPKTGLLTDIGRGLQGEQGKHFGALSEAALKAAAKEMCNIRAQTIEKGADGAESFNHGLGAKCGAKPTKSASL